MTESRSAIEVRRQNKLAEFRILDTRPEAVFDELVKLAAESCQTPMAILSLMDADRQWFKASIGLDVAETPRNLAFCESVVKTCRPMTVNDTADSTFRDNPLVTGPLNIGFYSGVPLLASDGSCIGSLAVLDTRPRKPEAHHIRTLKAFARLAMRTIELRLTRLVLEDTLADQRRLLDRVSEGDHAVESTHQQLNRHLENMPVALLEMNAELKVVRWSPKAQQMFGWSTEEVLGQSLDRLSMVHPDDRAMVSRKVARLLAAKADDSLTLVNRNVTRDGETRLCEWHNSAHFDKEGRLLSILSFATDITDRTRTEDALQLSEERYRHAAEASQAALWDYDMVTGRVTFSEAFRDMLGYERIEDMPDTLEAYMELMHPEDRERVRREAERLVAGETGERATAEFRLLTQSGEYRWVQSNSKVIRDHQGQAIRRLGSMVDIHKRRVAEKKLREQAERMRGVLETASDAIITIDENAVIESVNPAAERMFGYSTEEMLGRNIRMLMPEAERNRHDDYLKHYRETGQARIIGKPQKLKARRKDGSLIPIELMVSEVKLADRRIFTGFIKDITSEEKARRAIEASEQRFKAVARTTIDVIWDLNLETGELWWSDGLERAFGYAVAEAGDELDWWVERIHPDDRDHVTASLDEALAKRTEWHGQYRFLCKDGLYADISDSGVTVAGEGGQPDRMVGGMTDITEQRQAREKLAEQASLLNKAHDAIFVADLDGVVTYWNQGAEKVYGWHEADMLGQSVVGRIIADRSRWEGAVAELRAAGIWEGQVRHRRRDGSQLDAQSRLTLVSDHDGRPRSILAINTDITEKLELEEQLRHAQRLESIGQLTGGVAHDFNNLLTVILGNAELLSESLDDHPALKQMAEMTQSAARRGAELTNQLLAFARRQTLDPQRVNVAELVAGMRPMLRHSIPEHIEIQVSHEPDLWDASIDPGQLESTLLNLALNARDAMPKGGRLGIRLDNAILDSQYAARHADVEPGEYVRVAVTDTGRGIRPEHMKRLFEPFFTTKTKGKGTGLGLPMVYGFIKQSSGHIRVDSEVGAGTTVRMYLPRASADQDSAPESRGLQTELVPHGSERILLVEDDPLVLEHVSRLIGQLGYRVTTAADGEHALELVRSRAKFDLLFTDVIMPGQLKGPQLVEEVRRIIPDIRVLLTSGYTEDAITPEMEGDDSFHLLQKPYRKAELARKLREVLDR